MRVNSQRIKSPTNFNLNSISLSLRITLFATAPQSKGIKPMKTCDHGDHLASITRSSEVPRRSGICASQKTQWIWGIYSAFFFGCIVEKNTLI
jgi:hypothetical protein